MKTETRVSKRKIPSLIIENIVDRGNLNMLSLLEHRRDQYLVIVDNMNEDVICAYVLDYARQEGIDLKIFIEVAEGWLAGKNAEYPLSFEMSRLGLTEVANKIYKTFDSAYVTRLVGRPFQFELTTPVKIKRRRANKVQAGIEIRPIARVLNFD